MVNEAPAVGPWTDVVNLLNCLSPTLTVCKLVLSVSTADPPVSVYAQDLEGLDARIRQACRAGHGGADGGNGCIKLQICIPVCSVRHGTLAVVRWRRPTPATTHRSRVCYGHTAVPWPRIPSPTYRAHPLVGSLHQPR
eukprot:3515147-Rhodomonas_salina.2